MAKQSSYAKISEQSRGAGSKDELADLQGTLEAEEILEHSQGEDEGPGEWEASFPSLNLVCSTAGLCTPRPSLTSEYDSG